MLFLEIPPKQQRGKAIALRRSHTEQVLCAGRVGELETFLKSLRGRTEMIDTMTEIPAKCQAHSTTSVFSEAPIVNWMCMDDSKQSGFVDLGNYFPLCRDGACLEPTDAPGVLRSGMKPEPLLVVLRSTVCLECEWNAPCLVPPSTVRFNFSQVTGSACGEHPCRC